MAKSVKRSKIYNYRPAIPFSGIRSSKTKAKLYKRSLNSSRYPIAGWLGLIVIIIKNVIVLIDEINVQHRQGIDLYTSIIEATVSRTRPVLMAATTTIFGMVPLLFDIAFRGMAATIIFGLTFATLLTLFVTPVLYVLFYKVKEKRV